MYDNEFRKRKIKIKPKKKLNHNIYTRNWIYYKKNYGKDKMEFVSLNILRVAWEWQRRIYLGSCSPRKSRFTCPRTCHDWGVVVVMAGGILLSLQKFTPSVLLLKTFD